MARNAIDADAAADERVLVVANPVITPHRANTHHHKYLPNRPRQSRQEPGT